MKNLRIVKYATVSLVIAVSMLFMVNVMDVKAIDLTTLEDIETISTTNTATDNEDANKNNAQNNAVVNNTTTKNSASKSKDDIPATGSNTEIIFAIGAITLVSITAVVFKKSRVKIK